MILRFPDLDTLQLSLTIGAIPPDVSVKPAVAGFDEAGRVWVEIPCKLPTGAQRELKRLGAVVCKSSSVPLNTEVSCWPQLLPLVREDAALDSLERTPVLFDVPSGEELSRLALEMLRLGNDRQSYRWLEDTNTGSRALLRVVGPPYYSLLRAIDQLGGPEIAPRAFVERTPGVWVEIGHRHPLAENIRPPKGEILLMRPPRQWLMLADAPFRDIYEIVEFQVPGIVTHWKDCALPHRLTVGLRLRQSGAADGAELWVLRSNAIENLNRFVQNAEDQLLGRLAFAVGEKNGQTIVVLRVRQSKQPPPVLVLPAEAYKSHLKLPNLFLPAGFALHPPLRRDVVRKLLADDPGQITWLVPAASGGCEPPGSFTPEGLPDDVFRPLTDWVDYVLDRDREQLQAWMQAMQFEFEPFICDEEQPSKPKKPPSAVRRPPPAARHSSSAKEQSEPQIMENDKLLAESGERITDSGEAFAAVEKMEPSEIEKELHAAEEEFLALPGGLDEASRRALWPRLANLNARLRQKEDAGICWLHALWDKEDAGRWAAAWFGTEVLHSDRAWLDNGTVSFAFLDGLLASPDPTIADLRALSAYLTWSAQRQPRPLELMQRLPVIQRFLEQHEKMLPVRACWLAWYHFVQLTDGDVLTLARARDRLLERLFHNGFRPEQDLPSFLRFAGQPNNRRGRGLGQWLLKVHELARRWVDRQPPGTIEYKEAKTKEYIDLLFAFGLARLGEQDASRQLLLRAEKILAKSDEAHAILFRLFEYRIRQAREGQAINTPLESEVLERLNELRRREQGRSAEKKKESGSHLSYVVDKMRGTSRILEPLQKIEEYRYLTAGSGGEVGQALARLPDIKDRKELAEQIHWLLKKGKTRLPDYVCILKSTLEQSPRAGEEIAQILLEQSLHTYDQSIALPADNKERPILEWLMNLLERGIFVAAHFGHLDVIQALMSRFRQLLREERESPAIVGFDRVIDQGLRGLRKLGLRDEIQELLVLMSDAILKGRDPKLLPAEEDAGLLCRTLLPIAAGWYDFDHDSLAEPIFQAARTLLLRKVLVPTEHRDLACAYAKALAAAPFTIIQERLEELFKRLEGIPNTSSFGNHYSPAQIKVVESVVQAVVSDDFTQGAQARRWLDEDEYLVRQRIHRDVRHLLTESENSNSENRTRMNTD